MIKTHFIYYLLVALSLCITSAYASTEETSKIITKVVNAYGGKTLTSAKSLKIIEHNKGPWPGESENPGLPEIWRINEELTIDFENRRKSLLSYRVPRTTVDLEKWIYDGEQGFIYDILHKKFSVEDWVNFDNLGGSLVRSSDTMHAKHLYSELEQATYLGTEFYRGRVHQKLAVTMKSGAKFTYFIDDEFGLIRKVLRPLPQSKLVYVFSNHQTSNGLTYASDMNFFVNGELRLSSVHRAIALNPEIEAAFSQLEGFLPWGEMIDNRTMTAKKKGSGVFQAGKGRSKTVFIEQPEHFVAIGSASALRENFEAIKTLSKVNKPLSYFVVSHHHRRNLMGLNNAIELGAKIVTAKAHTEVVLESLPETATNPSIIVVPDRQPFELGNITLFDIPTAHSQHYLMAYSAQNKMVIAEEHYEVQLKTEKPRIYKDMVIFSNALSSLNISVEKLIDIQSWRAIKMSEFTQWVTDFDINTCPDGYDICSKG